MTMLHESECEFKRANEILQLIYELILQRMYE